MQRRDFRGQGDAQRVERRACRSDFEAEHGAVRVDLLTGGALQGFAGDLDPVYDGLDFFEARREDAWSQIGPNPPPPRDHTVPSQLSKEMIKEFKAKQGLE